MNITRIGRTTSSVESRRVRQTPKQKSPFEVALRGGAQVLLAGARIASGAVGLPMLSAAVNTAADGTPGNREVSASAVTGTAPGTAKSNEEVLKDLQGQRMEDDLRLLALQNKIQQQNRQISLVSNVMRAKHETAKSAIGNIRA